MSTGSNAAAPYQPDVPPSQSEGKDRGSAGPVALRWWPAMLLLILMVGLRFGIRQLESPPLSVMMIGFMGPAVVALLLLVWWLFASRAGIKEKLVGFASIIGMIILSVFVCDPSLQGMVTGMYVVPSAIAMFAVGLILQASKPATRLPVALVLALIALVYWGMLRSEGVTGRFDGEFAWRWEPKAEDEYVKSLANSDSSTVPTPDLPGETSITLVSAEWPSFRGPHRDGKQPGVHLNTDWQANPPKQIWSRQIGPGWSSFVVAGRRLFTQEQRGKQEAVVCLDANTGNQLWAYTYESRFEEAIAGAGPRATPTIADEGLFALGGAGILVALNP